MTQSCGSYMQEEDVKGQSSIRVKTGSVVSDNKKGIFEVC